MIGSDYKKRLEDILDIIVRSYIDTAEPVGSRFVARRLGLSSATIRNAMSDLEDMGLIMHPHTSAGRIPTDKGYRYYIDSLMRVKRLNDHIVRMVGEQYHQTIRSLEDILERTSHLISSLTNYVGIALLPAYEKVYTDGASHLIEQPEFRDVRKLYNFLKCLEAKREIIDFLMEDLNNEKLTIYIGKENRASSLNDCAVITRGYRLKGRPAGRVGVIGPKRMLYERVIPTIDLLADSLTEILENFEA